MAATKIDPPFDQLITPELVALGQSLAEALDDLPSSRYRLTVTSGSPGEPVSIELDVEDPIRMLAASVTLIYPGEWVLVDGNYRVLRNY